MTRTETYVPFYEIALLSPGHTHPLATANPRKSGHDIGIEELQHTLHDQGVLQPLRVFPRDDGEPGAWVYIGERRLLASQRNIEKYADALTTVPVIMVDGITPEEAFRESLVEQVNRLPLHPIDQFEAFAVLMTGGMTENGIADYYSVPKQVVRQRVALGNIAPEIRKAWREGVIDEDCAKEFTRLVNHKDQISAFKRLAKINSLFARAVRGSLVPDQGEGASLVNFVGLDSYRARGGEVYEDLFNGMHGISDAALAKVMADEKLESVALQLTSLDGWSWAKPASAMPAMWRSYAKSEPKSSLTVDEKRRLEEINARFEDELTDEEGAALNAEGEGIHRAAELRAFTPRQKAKSGCVLAVSVGGDLTIYAGIILPAEEEDAHEPERAAAGPARANSKEPEPEAPPVPKLSNAQASDLAVTLTEGTALAVAGNFNLSMAIALAAFATNSDGMPARLRHSGMGRNTLKLSGKTDFASNLKAFLAMKPQQRESLFAQVVAASLQFDSHTAEHHAMTDKDIAALVNAVDPKIMATMVLKRFDAEAYFNKAPKAFALAAIGDVFGKAEAKFSDSTPKGDLVAYAVENVAPAKWQPEELRHAGYTGPGAKKPKPVKVAAKATAKSRPAKKKAKG